MPLLPPLAADHDPDVLELSRFFHETLGFVPRSVLTMQRRPAIARAFIGLNRAVMANEGRVTSEQKRLIGLVASTAAGCRYCQAHTALAASRYGATAARLRDIWQFRDSPLFSEAERSAFEFALVAASVPNAVTPEIAARLHAHWDEGEVVEILAVISLFGFLNRWNDSMSTELEDGAMDAGQTFLSHTGWTPGKHGSRVTSA